MTNEIMGVTVYRQAEVDIGEAQMVWVPDGDEGNVEPVVVIKLKALNADSSWSDMKAQFR